jgi:glycosyltransferase involved in cell wall biosynthesis
MSITPESPVRRVLITGPLLADPGGVASYYSHVLPVLHQNEDFHIEYLEIGSSRGAAGIFHPVADQIRINRTLSKGNFDLVHVNPSLEFKSFLRDGLFVRQACQRRIPVIVFFRGWDDETARRIEKRWQWLFRLLYGRASLFIVLGSAFERWLRQWGISVPIVMATTTVPDRALLQFSLDKKMGEMKVLQELRVLFLARLEPGKGALATLEGVSQLIHAGYRVRLTIAGDGSEMDDVLKSIERNPTLGLCVSVAGYVRGDYKAHLLASHHVYCLPTAGEGMPNSLLEAMAFGMAIITCGVGGITDFFEDGVMGYLLEKASGSEVADKLRKLVSQPRTISDMAAYNHRFAKETFSAQQVGTKLIEVYRKVLGVHE